MIGGVSNTGAKPVAPPLWEKATPTPVRVGGRIRPPKAITQVRPNYPPLPRQAHIQGQVQIDAILDGQGNVIDMKVVSGPPLLYQAALDALKKWKYEPTYLNDQPIAVEMIVTITFVVVPSRSADCTNATNDGLPERVRIHHVTHYLSLWPFAICA